MIVYGIRNTINGKRYVGQTTGMLRVRLSCHRSDSTRKDTALARAIRKYGWEAFEVETLETCETQEALNEAEIRWVSDLRSQTPHGYNMMEGGKQHGSHDEATKAKIGNASRGRIKSAETIELLRGRAVTDEVKGTLRSLYAGDKSKNVKLDWEKVRSLRARSLAGESDVALAKAFSVSRSTIHNIRTNRQWVEPA